ncbi:UvrD-helicase domain-containing protein [Embleya sp. NPDC020630]|uniref:UvrD-helicase domain-containing protein n=1 Tax=Embleya sp. NPDC020630 TaxID=3363979 RepID=UPI0037A72068
MRAVEAGGSLARLARDARARERELRREWVAARRTALRFEAASAAEQRVVAHLLLLLGYGWRLLADRRWPGTRAANVDLVLVGPGGIHVVDVKNWRDAPRVADGHLFAGERPRDDEAAKLSAITRIAEEAVGPLGISPVAVQPLMVFAGHRVDAVLGRIRLLGEAQVGPDLAALPARLDPAAVAVIADRLARVFPAYEDTVRAPVDPVPPGPRDGAFDPREFAAATLRAARLGPIERWMTYLDPGQCDLVRADWPGPARITGPAGTGKTVVGLHRAAYLAQHGAGRVLYVTFTANLPRVQRTFLADLAPVAVDRVDFHTIHSWALRFLDEHGARPPGLDAARAAAAFDRAWSETSTETRQTRTHERLTRIAASPAYWRQEIDHLIKGRGIETSAEYARLPRPGRRTRLTRAGDHDAVWRLYRRYEQLLRAEGISDFNDVLTAALRQARRRPRVASPYTSVIVDEVQDLTLVGVRLLHTLVGDAPNGLLLIGDGQQAVHPGGFRLADAGLVIPDEHTHVLRRNYRNAPDIVRAALEVVASDGYEDPALGRVTAPRPLEFADRTRAPDTPAEPNPAVIRANLPSPADHDAALLTTLLADPRTWPDTAVLCRSGADVVHYADLLARAGIPVCPLARYEGRTTAGVKVGGYIRAKGLEFKHVLLPRYDLAHSTCDRGGLAARERAEAARRRLFIAMVRARDTLWLGHVTPASTPNPPTPPGHPTRPIR